MDFINGPKLKTSKIKEYLSRIGVSAMEEPTPEYLIKLQKGHITHIPFENLDIMNGRELSLDREVLFEKIIINRRGGVCSELNTLYNWLLESLGFDVTSYISRIIAKTAPLQANSHRVMAVRFGKDVYITDVGFNYSHHRIPLLLEEGRIQSDGDCSYRFERDDFFGWVMHQETADGWRKKISFNESPQTDMDFIGPTYFAQHHLDSRINKALKVSLYISGKFYAIREGTFLTEEHGIVKEIEKVVSAEREAELLSTVFGLETLYG